MSNSQAISEPSKFQRLLYNAQGGKCFHCAEPMFLVVPAGSPKKRGATREHIFPHATTGKALVNNVVLAHAVCNGERGDRAPSPQEIAKAARIYHRLGFPAFVPITQWHGPLKHQQRAMGRAIEELRA